MLVIIGLFFTLDIFLLINTFIISDQVKQDAITINLSGRQRMLSQRMMKCLLMLDRFKDEQQRINNLNELRLTFNQFDSTLSAFRLGGTVENADGKMTRLTALSGRDTMQLAEDGESQWQPYRIAVTSLLAAEADVNPAHFDTLLKQAVSIGIERNQSILKLMNKLTVALEENAVRKTNQLHLIQSLMMGLAITSFCIMLLLMRRELSHINKSKNALNQVIHKINAGLLIYDERGIVVAANKTAGTIFGFKVFNELIGKAHHHLVFKRGNQLLGRHQDGSVFPVSSHCSELSADDKDMTLETVADISLQQSVEESLSKLAYYDALTGLPNRLLFDDRLLQGILSANRQGSKLALLFVDLNEFKPVNDTYGHHVGDMLLKEIANRLHQQLREEDTISRLGGDEFVVLLTSITSKEDCEMIIHKLLQALRAPFEVDTVLLYPDASIGACIYPDDGEQDLMVKADQAMYIAKRDKDKHYAFYSQAD
ncbi:MAG TPA: diguanylate cyclase [Methylophilaceae bacterium]|nr:diguanylate cyclase [Methylophilaceae bacterium]